MKAFIENGNIFIQDVLIPKDAVTIDVPDNTTIDDLIIDNGVLRLKTEIEKEADRKRKETEEALLLLKESDSQMIRVVEDLVDILLSKKIIDIKDLPDAVNLKINQRKELREKLK